MTSSLLRTLTFFIGLTVGLLLPVLQVSARSANAATGDEDLQSVERTDPRINSRALATPAVDARALSDLGGILPELAEKRVVFVGELHTRLEHHQNQLEIIKGLHAYHPDLGIGVEFFQQPFQQHLDDYIAGRIDEPSLLKNTEYFKRWRFDYRLYAPIIRYARENAIPVIALNLPGEISSKVGAGGIVSLSEEERRRIPLDIDRSMEPYRQRLEAVFALHPRDGPVSFENFYEAQLLWDETMAERAARALKDAEVGHLVVLAGNGHLEFGFGIPQRVLRRLPVESAIVLNATLDALEPGIADYLLFPRQRALPPAGKLGLLLDADNGGVTISAFTSDSAGKVAGLKKNDRVLELDGMPVSDMAGVRVVMWERRPGDRVSVKVRRKRWLFPAKEIEYEVQLR